MSGEINRA